MGIRFESNSFYDAIIFADGGIDLDNAFSQEKHNLVGQAKQRAFAEFKESYDAYKQNLNLKFGQYLSCVEENIDELKSKDTSQKIRKLVTNKLREVTIQRIGKESDFSRIHRLFHKIGQFFCGHGFRTKGEWGIELASRIEKFDLKIDMDLLKDCIYGGALRKVGVENMKDNINAQTEKKFKRILKDIIFKKNEKTSKGKNKYTFYQNLNDEKKAIFYMELLSSPQWFRKAFDVIEGHMSNVGLNLCFGAGSIAEFISKEMVEKFQAEAQITTDFYKSKKIKNVFFESFFSVLVELAVQDYLEKDQFQKIYDLDAIVGIQKGYQFPLVLTKEQVEKLNKNVVLS